MQQIETIPGRLEQAHIWPGVPGSQLGRKAFWEREEGEEESAEGRRASSSCLGAGTTFWGDPRTIHGANHAILLEEGGAHCPLNVLENCPTRQESDRACPTGGWDGSPLDGAGARARAGALRTDGSRRDPPRPADPGWGGPAFPRSCLCAFVSALLPSSDEPPRVMAWHVWDQ